MKNLYDRIDDSDMPDSEKREFYFSAMEENEAREEWENSF